LRAETEAIVEDQVHKLPSHAHREKLEAVVTEMTNLCERWRECLHDLPAGMDDIAGEISAVVGMATLLLTDKLKQARIARQCVMF
jgi:hypothetical protein